MGAMARPLRIGGIGCWYHLTARGNERRDIGSGIGMEMWDGIWCCIWEGRFAA